MTTGFDEATAMGKGAIDPEARASRLGRRMVAIGFLSINLGIGLCYGTFGVMVLDIERHFGVGRAEVSLALSFVALAHGLIAPVIGMLIGRIGIRPLMVAGALMSSLGFMLIPSASGSLAMFAIYGLLIGPGTALLGVVPVLTLVNNWFSRNQGRLMGIVMMPVVITVAPLAVVAAKPVLGLTGIFYVVAGLFIGALPLLLAVIDAPERVGLEPVGGAPAHAGASGASEALTAFQLLRSPRFLLIVLASGLIVGAGVSKNVHFVPILTEQGWDISRAAFLLSISGATGIAGSLLFGYLADRFSSSGALAINALLQACVWLILILPSPFALLVVDAVVIGACGGGVASAKGVFVNRFFGRANFARVSGLSALTTIPFVFAISPIVGALRERFGNYELPLAAIIILFIVASLCCASLVRTEKRLITAN
jgi:MFS family permease